MNNRKVLAIRQVLEPQHKIVIVDYERFWSHPENARHLLEAVGLDPVRSRSGQIAEEYGTALRLKEKHRDLPADAMTYIDRNFDFESQSRALAAALE